MHHARRLVCLVDCRSGCSWPCDYIGFTAIAGGANETSAPQESQPHCVKVDAPQREIQRQTAQRIALLMRFAQFPLPCDLPEAERFGGVQCASVDSIRGRDLDFERN